MSLDVADKSSSWADMVRSIDHERKKLPWDPKKESPVKRVDLYERKRAEREFDPVAMQYRNPEREDMYRTRKLEKEAQKIERVKELRQNSFNIVSHKGPPRKVDTIFDEMRGSKSRVPRQYHMLTNMSHDDHEKAPFFYSEGYNLQRAGARIPPRTDSAAAVRREFSIISNEYFENGLERKQQERDRLKQELLEKYWKTHEFDPLRGRYYDREREEQYQQQREALKTVHGASVLDKIPPSIKYSDGNSYDIINHHTLDGQRLRATMTMNDRSLNRIKRTEKEEIWKKVGEKASLESEVATLARVSFKRWEGQLDRGFDIVKNSVSVEKDLPHPLPDRPNTMWARLQVNSGSGPRSAMSSAQGCVNGGGNGIGSAPKIDAPGDSRGHGAHGGRLSSESVPVSKRHPLAPGRKPSIDPSELGGGVAKLITTQAGGLRPPRNLSGGAATAGGSRVVTRGGARDGGEGGVPSSSGYSGDTGLVGQDDVGFHDDASVRTFENFSNALTLPVPAAGDGAVKAAAQSEGMLQRSGYSSGANSGRDSCLSSVHSNDDYLGKSGGGVEGFNNNSNTGARYPSLGSASVSAAKSVPSLDLTRAEGPESVSYVEPTKGPMGLAVPIVPITSGVRTGGLSGL